MTKELFRRKSHQTRMLLIGVALAAVGGILFTSTAGLGGVLVVAGLMVVGFGVVRGRAPLVTMEPTRVQLHFAEPRTIPFHNITAVELLSSQDLSLALSSGARVVIPMARLEENDGAWLKKELRKEVRLAQRKS
jgi:hypothetical protein